MRRIINSLWCLALLYHCANALNPVATTSTTTSNNISKPGCQSQCGNLTVPYPFGIGNGCAIDDHHFVVHCNTSTNVASLSGGSIEVYDISNDTLRVSNVIAYNCYNSLGTAIQNISVYTQLSGTPYSFSSRNMFSLVGCDDYAFIYGRDMEQKNYTFGCLSVCSNTSHAIENQCSGLGCCQVPVPKGLKYYRISMRSFANHTRIWRSNWCGLAFLGEEDRFHFGGASDLNNASTFWRSTLQKVPIVLDWAIGNVDCSVAQQQSNYSCQVNSDCIDLNINPGGYLCKCKQGYHGNPYLEPGCQDIDECANSTRNVCAKTCHNTPGNYTCSCPPGYSGDGFLNGTGCKKARFPIIKLTIGIAGSIIVILFGITWLYLIVKKRNLILLKEELFRQNGGFLLKQQMSKNRDGIETTRIFTADELGKATKNYADAEILGQGGYGTVYKGVLSDKRVVAVKKSKIVDKSQIEQFINEVIIVTQINHRNVVKLLGCCLEDQVPLLVYEFVPNNTLFYHIHHGQGNWLSWDNRLRIAAESAGALAYLHSAASVPIIHRDVKSTNILLDDTYTAKISDFGASRLIPLDQTELTTLVQGTLGYLDPEYFHSNQLTTKSDVYSFGVVLAELLTGKEPLCMNRTKEERNLTMYVVKSIAQNRLFQILEPRILREGTLDQIQAVGELVKSCVKLTGEERPTMKQVAMELENIRHSNRHPWSHVYDHVENEGLMMSTNEASDLFPISVDTSLTTTSQEISGQYSSDTSSLLFPVNSPR